MCANYCMWETSCTCRKCVALTWMVIQSLSESSGVSTVPPPGFTLTGLYQSRSTDYVKRIKLKKKQIIAITNMKINVI